MSGFYTASFHSDRASLCSAMELKLLREPLGWEMSSCWHCLPTGAIRYALAKCNSWLRRADIWLGRTGLALGEPGVGALSAGIRDSWLYGKHDMAQGCGHPIFTFIRVGGQGLSPHLTGEVLARSPVPERGRSPPTQG